MTLAIFLSILIVGYMFVGLAHLLHRSRFRDLEPEHPLRKEEEARQAHQLQERLQMVFCGAILMA